MNKKKTLTNFYKLTTFLCNSLWPKLSRYKEPKTYSISDLFFSFQSSNDVYNAPMDITKKLNVELNKLSFNISNM
ncbi:hypothetical protein BpHYR1_016311 [Brachionus plicatilis]|uniref:Uncharacterized protein n=1 Tax=Brachionus plicatilis TaxID=10195 RepID=A0A3M7RQX0_BRAPC|nr:hypothetical protein BpHYR1_016311 [Brachionus plicatilis]